MTKRGQISNFFLKMILLKKNIQSSRTFRQIKPAIIYLESYTGKVGKAKQSNCTKFYTKVYIYIPLYLQNSPYWFYRHKYMCTGVCIHINFIHTHCLFPILSCLGTQLTLEDFSYTWQWNLTEREHLAVMSVHFSSNLHILPLFSSALC